MAVCKGETRGIIMHSRRNITPSQSHLTLIHVYFKAGIIYGIGVFIYENPCFCDSNFPKIVFPSEHLISIFRRR